MNYICENIYEIIDNDNDVIHAKQYINYATNKYKKSPIDNYRIGGVYDFVLHDPQSAQNYYMAAIEQIKHNPSNENIFIIDRLEDRIRINRDAEIDDNRFMLHELINLENELKTIETKLEKKINPIKVIWKSDSQNVHDSNINNELKEDYKKIVKYNKDNNIYLWDINEIQQYIKNVNDGIETHNIEDALKMIDYINNRGGTIMKLQTDEKTFLCNVFSKIQTERNNKKKILLENLLLNLKESYSGGTPVCITGRTTRILSSFAGDDDLGVFKSKPVIKNEIMTKAAEIRNKFLENSPDELQNKYNNGEETPEVKDLETNIKNNIDNMLKEDYFNLFTEDKKFMDNIINEIHMSI